MNNDASNILSQQLNESIANDTAVRIAGGESKRFYGHAIGGHTISTTEHTGIIEYQPSELVVTVRSGTLLNELEAELAAKQQMLAFEPPQHSETTTIGGVIACGLSGPRRVFSGSARDFVLGTTIINGKGETCRFGGQVMKNVAGYDASRLMVAAQGTLGLLLDVSLKVLPVSDSAVSIMFESDLSVALADTRRWINQGLPISASCYFDQRFYVRLESTASAVKQALKTIAERFAYQEIPGSFWQDINNQSHPFFSEDASTPKQNLWRFSHHDAARLLEPEGSPNQQLIEWHGALGWVKTEADIHALASKHQGNATRYRCAEEYQGKEIFQPLQPALLKLHQRLKHAFDPQNLINPGRIYPDL